MYLIYDQFTSKREPFNYHLSNYFNKNIKITPNLLKFFLIIKKVKESKN